MSFIEKQKKRIAEQIASEQKRKSDLRKELNKVKEEGDLIYKNVGSYLHKLLKKVNEIDKEAIQNNCKIDYPDSYYNEDKLDNWTWNINWEEIDWEDLSQEDLDGHNSGGDDLIPRLCGHFEHVYHFPYGNSLGDSPYKFDPNGKVCYKYFYNEDDHRYSEYNLVEFYIKILFDSDMENLRIIAKAGYEGETRFKDDDIEKKKSHWIHADYLEKGITLPIENNNNQINRLADSLIEILYTWKIEEYEQIIKAEDERKEIERKQVYINSIKREKKKKEKEYQKKYDRIKKILFIIIIGGIIIFFSYLTFFGGFFLIQW